MLGIAVTTVLAMIISLLVSRQKTYQGIRQGLMMFWGLFPDVVFTLLILSLILALVPTPLIVQYLGPNAGTWAWVMASFIGSIVMMPGFVAFPLAAILYQAGVAINVIAVFITTLMMVGIVTAPVEVKFFGWRATLLRNLLSLLGALLIGWLMGIFL